MAHMKENINNSYANKSAAFDFSCKSMEKLILGIQFWPKSIQGIHQRSQASLITINFQLEMF